MSYNDFYGHIELGKNIFNHFNFIVPWQLDNPVGYPPLFSILVHLVTIFTKDAVVSNQYLNAFSSSYSLIPLYLLVKKLLNIPSAFLAVIFTTCCFGLIGPCAFLGADYFFDAMTITTSWLIWEVLTRKDQKAWNYLLVGSLTGLAYLTKYTGILYCFIGIISVIYFFSLIYRDMKAGLKMATFLLLGFLPLFIVYHVLLYNHAKKEKIISISTYTFFDGNYFYEGNREKKMYRLNPEGTDFEHLSICRADNAFTFSLKHPRFMVKKYAQGLQMIIRGVTHRVFPFFHGARNIYYDGLQLMLVILLMMAAFYYRRPVKIVYVSLFVFIMLLIPIYIRAVRYAMPFVPFYFILWLFGMNALYRLPRTQIKNNYKRVLKLSAVAVCVFLVMIYSADLWRKSTRLLSSNEKLLPEGYGQASSWIKNDSRDRVERIKIMSRKTTYAYLTDASFVALPYTMSWEKIVRFALLKNVDYLVLDEAILRFRSDQWKYLTENMPEDPHIRLGYRGQGKNNAILIFRISA
ncbi:MAG: glycosyltransferase family 39 protein [Candidatus Omnitrophica bacterium]|nr:glycosyltransferase family 39 protein [Candidatus Omnitrophota bacterium]